MVMDGGLGNQELEAPSTATEAVLKPSESMPEGSKQVQGIDFDQYREQKMTVEDLVAGMANMGFQATSVGDSIRIINEMVHQIPTQISTTKLTFFREPGGIQRHKTRPQSSWVTLQI
jgi:hypothetical protein